MDDKNRKIITVVVILLAVVAIDLWYSYGKNPSGNNLAAIPNNATTSTTSTVAGQPQSATTTATVPRKKYVAPVKTPVAATSTKDVSKIVLSHSGLTNVSWKVTGYSKGGFYLVWSQSIHPTYPVGKGGQFKYYADPAANLGTIITNSKKGIFYVRVCESLGTVCGAYSNEISFSL